jgi:hypothetical protein
LLLQVVVQATKLTTAAAVVQVDLGLVLLLV